PRAAFPPCPVSKSGTSRQISFRARSCRAGRLARRPLNGRANHARTYHYGTRPIRSVQRLALGGRRLREECAPAAKLGDVARAFRGGRFGEKALNAAPIPQLDCANR